MNTQSEQQVITLITFDVTADKFDDVARTAAAAMRERVSTLSGYIGGIILTDESRSRIFIEIEWASRDSWAKAEWDHVVGDALAQLYEDSASYDLQLFFPLSRFEPRS